MASRYAMLKKEKTLGSINTKKISDFDETDPYYFIVKEDGKILAEGELTMVKLKLPLEYFDKIIKDVRRDRSNMTCHITY